MLNLLVLGGSNDEKGELDNYTKERCDKAIKIISQSKQKFRIHFSGGFNKKFDY